MRHAQCATAPPFRWRVGLAHSVPWCAKQLVRLYLRKHRFCANMRQTMAQRAAPRAGAALSAGISTGDIFALYHGHELSYLPRTGTGTGRLAERAVTGG